MPPHIFLLTAVGVGLIAGYRLAYRALKTRGSNAEPKVKPSEPRDLGVLDWDERAGAYRPRHR